MTPILVLSIVTAIPQALPSVSKQGEPTAETSPVSALNPRYTPPPTPSRWGPKLIIGTGASLIVAGLAGMAFGRGCQTHDAQDRCVDPYGGSSLYPSLVVLGLGVTVTGGYWYRRMDSSAEVRSP